MMKMLMSVALVALFGVNLSAQEVKLTGENTKIEFTGTKTDGKHTGGFKKVTGTATGPASDLKLELTIDIDSLYSDDEKLTGHLKSPDFFNVKEFPKATFKFTKTEKDEKGMKHTGELTMLGKTKPVSFVSMTTMEGGVLRIASEFKIKRSDWGMNYGMPKVNDEVALKISVDAK